MRYVRNCWRGAANGVYSGQLVSGNRVTLIQIDYVDDSRLEEELYTIVVGVRVDNCCVWVRRLELGEMELALASDFGQ